MDVNQQYRSILQHKMSGVQDIILRGFPGDKCSKKIETDHDEKSSYSKLRLESKHVPDKDVSRMKIAMDKIIYENHLQKSSCAQ